MFSASCHCGSVRLEIARRPRTLTECNCSICGRLGAQWAYYMRTAVRVVCRKGAMQAYSYGRKTYEYHHCKRCGCVTHYGRVNVKHTDRVAVNARMMDPKDVASVPIRRLDVRKGKRSQAQPGER
jgi:hypothetical protein